MKKQLAVLLVLVVSAVGCGGGDEPTAADRAAASASASGVAASESAAAAAEEEAAQKAAAEARRVARKQRLHDACQRGTGKLAKALREVDSRLAIGLNQSEYGNYIGTAQVAYDDLFRGPDLSGPCLLKVAIPLEGALNVYIDVYNVWGDCLEDYNCDFNEGEANRKTQAGWAKASTALGNAERGLRKMQP